MVAERGPPPPPMPLPGCPVTVLAGDKKPGLADGRGTEARFKFPGGLKLDAQDNAIVSDMGNGRICGRAASAGGEPSRGFF